MQCETYDIALVAKSQKHLANWDEQLGHMPSEIEIKSVSYPISLVDDDGR